MMDFNHRETAATKWSKLKQQCVIFDSTAAKEK